MQDMSKIDIEWLRGLPKCELHLHLEGTIEPETLVELSERHDETPFTLEQAKALYKTNSFLDFLRAFGQVTRRLQTVDDYALITYRMIQSLANQGVRHAEVFISFGDVLHSKTHLTLDDVMAAVTRAQLKGQEEYGVSIYWIADIIRQHEIKWAIAAVKQTIVLRKQYPSLVGIGIGGNELTGPAELFKDLFTHAKSNGLHVTAHAGESVGPTSIWSALSVGAERIGHGLTAAQDSSLVKHLKELQTPVEMCVTSNICTETCKDILGHPIRQFFDQGLLVTVNSDDPAMFRSNLLNEYVLLNDKLSFSKKELRQLACNSIIASFLDEKRKTELLDECSRYA